MKQLIQIVQKSIIKFQVIFETGLVTSRSNSAYKGYQKSFPDSIEIAHASKKSEGTFGPVHVDILWDEVHEFMNATIEWMVPFLDLFGV